MKNIKNMVVVTLAMTSVLGGTVSTAQATAVKPQLITHVTYSKRHMYQAGKIGSRYLFINLTGKKLYMSASYYHNGKYVMGHKRNKVYQSPNGDDVIVIKPHNSVWIKERPQGIYGGKYKVVTDVTTKLSPVARTEDYLSVGGK